MKELNFVRHKSLKYVTPFLIVFWIVFLTARAVSEVIFILGEYRIGHVVSLFNLRLFFLFSIIVALVCILYTRFFQSPIRRELILVPVALIVLYELVTLGVFKLYYNVSNPNDITSFYMSILITIALLFFWLVDIINYEMSKRKA